MISGRRQQVGSLRLLWLAFLALLGWLRRMLWTLSTAIVLFVLWGIGLSWLIRRGSWWGFVLVAPASVLFAAEIVALNRIWHDRSRWRSEQTPTARERAVAGRVVAEAGHRVLWTLCAAVALFFVWGVIAASLAAKGEWWAWVLLGIATVLFLRSLRGLNRLWRDPSYR